MLFTSININKAAKSDGAWFQDYLGIYSGQIQAGFEAYGGIYSNADDMVGVSAIILVFNADAAREFADNGGYVANGVVEGLFGGNSQTDADGINDLLISYAQPDAQPRFEAGSDKFNEALQNSIDTPYSIGGSGFTSTSQYNDIEAMYDFGNQFSMGNLLVGGNYKMYRPETGGTIYSDTPDIVAEHGNIEVNERGIYAQISK